MTNSSTIKASGSTPLVLESTITGGTIYAFTTALLGEIQLNGANLTNVTLTGSGSSSAGSDFNVTGASTFTGTINNSQYNTITVNALLNLSGATVSNFGSGKPLFVVNAGGTLNNLGSTSSIGGTDIVKMVGGTVSNSGGGAFTINTPITGYGTVSGPLTIGSNGNIQASGGTLTVDGTSGTGITLTGNSLLTDGVSGSFMDLKGNINFGSSGFLYSNPSGGAGSGVVQLDGAILNGTINSSLLGQGTVNVVNNSSLNGTYYSSATMGINTGKTFTIAGSTLNTNVGSLTNNGTFAISNGKLTNLTANPYLLGGGGSITLAGGSITSSGGGDFYQQQRPQRLWHGQRALYQQRQGHRQWEPVEPDRGYEPEPVRVDYQYVPQHGRLWMVRSEPGRTRAAEPGRQFPRNL